MSQLMALPKVTRVPLDVMVRHSIAT